MILENIWSGHYDRLELEWASNSSWICTNPPTFSCRISRFASGGAVSLSIDEKSWESCLRQRGLCPSPRQRPPKKWSEKENWENYPMQLGTLINSKMSTLWASRRAEKSPPGLLAFTVSTPSPALAWEWLVGSLSLQASSVITHVSQRPMSE